MLQTIDKLPDKVVLQIFSYLSHREICRLARTCRKWRMIAYDSRLWKSVSLRPDCSGLHVNSLEALLALIRFKLFLFASVAFNFCYSMLSICIATFHSISFLFQPTMKNVLIDIHSIRFGPSLRYIELPIELITHTVLHELGSKCPNLTHMLLDFSTAMQLHDFNELQVHH